MLSPSAICTVCMTGPTNEQINSLVMSLDDFFPLILVNITERTKKPIAQNCQESGGAKIVTNKKEHHIAFLLPTMPIHTEYSTASYKQYSRM